MTSFYPQTVDRVKGPVNPFMSMAEEHPVSSDPEFFIRSAFAINPQEGLALLFRQYYSPLCSHALRFVYDRPLAEDLVSDVFYQFWRTRAYDSIKSSYLSYLFTSVRNEAFTHLRREFGKNDSLDLTGEQVPYWQTLPDAEVYYNQLFQKVNEIIGRLPPQQQRVFMLHRFENKKYHEIADELNISARTVEVHMMRALRQIREVLQHGWLAVFLGLYHFFS